MAGQGVVDVLTHAEADLDGVVAVVLLRLDLDDDAGAGLDDGDAARLAVGREDLRHPQLPPDNRFHGYSLISMSTPAGSCSRISVSTVRDDGSMMSMRRLCVRISNCSPESLSTNGDLLTVNFLISVGRGIGPATDTPVRSAASTICSADWSRMRWS